MNRLFSSIAKLSLIALYLSFPLSFFIAPFINYAQAIQLVVAVLAVVHLAEFFLLKKRFAAHQGNHFVMTMLFGFLYWKPLLQADKAEGS